jgi:hypothetical protein
MQRREAWRCDQLTHFALTVIRSWCSACSLLKFDSTINALLHITLYTTEHSKALDAVCAREELKALERLKPPGAACQQSLHIPLQGCKAAAEVHQRVCSAAGGRHAVLCLQRSQELRLEALAWRVDGDNIGAAQCARGGSGRSSADRVLEGAAAAGGHGAGVCCCCHAGLLLSPLASCVSAAAGAAVYCRISVAAAGQQLCRGLEWCPALAVYLHRTQRAAPSCGRQREACRYMFAWGYPQRNGTSATPFVYAMVQASFSPMTPTPA